MERLNGFEGERLPCVCGYHGRGSHICGLAYPCLMISDSSDDQIRHCDKLVWYIYDILFQQVVHPARNRSGIFRKIV